MGFKFLGGIKFSLYFLQFLHSVRFSTRALVFLLCFLLPQLLEGGLGSNQPEPGPFNPLCQLLHLLLPLNLVQDLVLMHTFFINRPFNHIVLLHEFPLQLLCVSSLGNPLLVGNLAGEDRVQLEVIEGFLR